MAGENILPNEHYPDYFQIVSVNMNHADVPATLDCVPIMYVEPRATNGTGIVVDDIAIGVQVIDAAEDVELIYATTPQATTGTSLQTAVTSLATVGTYEPTINIANNFVPAGNWILAKFSDGVDAAHIAVTLRFRSRLK
jgi:hypothetical protein